MDSFILTLDSQLLYGVIIQLISTSILVAILNNFLYTPVSEFLEKRKNRVEGNIKEANEKLTAADTLKHEYEIKLAEIEKERTNILEDARTQAKKNEAQIISEAKAEATNIKNRATSEIEREQEKAKEDIKLQIIEVSSLVAGKFIQEKINEQEQAKLIDQVIADLGDAKWQN